MKSLWTPCTTGLKVVKVFLGSKVWGKLCVKVLFAHCTLCLVHRGRRNNISHLMSHFWNFWPEKYLEPCRAYRTRLNQLQICSPFYGLKYLKGGSGVEECNFKIGFKVGNLCTTTSLGFRGKCLGWVFSFRLRCS